MLNIKKFDWEKRVQSNIKLKQVMIVSNKSIVSSNNHPTTVNIIDVTVNNNSIVIALSNHYLLRWNLSIDYSMNSSSTTTSSSNNTTNSSSNSIGGISKSEYDYIDLSPIIKGTYRIDMHLYPLLMYELLPIYHDDTMRYNEMQ